MFDRFQRWQIEVLSLRRYAEREILCHGAPPLAIVREASPEYPGVA